MKFLPVMHISVRHDIFYDFSSGIINVKNKEKKTIFVAHFHKVFKPRPLTSFDLRPQVLYQTKNLIELHNSWRQQFWF